MHVKRQIFIFLFAMLSADVLQAKTYIEGYQYFMNDTTEEKLPSWEIISTVGLNLTHTLNVNAPKNAPKQGFATTNALDLTTNYIKDKSLFKAYNELHWTFAFFKAKTNAATQNTADQMQTLHDIALSFNIKGVWNINLISKIETPIFTLYESNYLRDYEQLGQAQRFINPYRLALSPGFKYQPQKWLGISISPYSIEFFGLTDQKIADKGQFVQDQEANGHYKLRSTELLGAETNIWITKKIKKIAEINYRINLSSNYFENTFKNGRMGGLFITKLNLYKNISLSHRAALKGNLSQKPFKPFYSQVILISYTFSK